MDRYIKKRKNKYDFVFAKGVLIHIKTDDDITWFLLKKR